MKGTNFIQSPNTSDLGAQCAKFNIQIDVSDISDTSFDRINHAVCDAFALYCNAS